MENRLENVEKIMKEYNHFIEEQEPKLSKEILDDIENKKKELGGNTRHLNRLKEELENLDTKNMGYVEMHAIMGEYKRQINEAQENVDKLKSEYDELLVKKEKMENPNKTYEEEQEDKTDRMNARGKAKKELTIELKEIDCDIEEKKIELQSKEFERKKFNLKYEEQEQSFEARDENGNLVTLTKKVKVPQNAEEYKKISEDISKIYGELEELAKAKSKCEEYIAQIDEEFKKEVEEINDILKRNTKKETSKNPSSLGGEDKEEDNSTEPKSEPKQATDKDTNKTQDDTTSKNKEKDKQNSTEPKPQEPKPQEPKSQESKSQESKSQKSKPQELKPQGQKPQEQKQQNPIEMEEIDREYSYAKDWLDKFFEVRTEIENYRDLELYKHLMKDLDNLKAMYEKGGNNDGVIEAIQLSPVERIRNYIENARESYQNNIGINKIEFREEALNRAQEIENANLTNVLTEKQLNYINNMKKMVEKSNYLRDVQVIFDAKEKSYIAIEKNSGRQTKLTLDEINKNDKLPDIYKKIDKLIPEEYRDLLDEDLVVTLMNFDLERRNAGIESNMYKTYLDAIKSEESPKKISKFLKENGLEIQYDLSGLDKSYDKEDRKYYKELASLAEESGISSTIKKENFMQKAWKFITRKNTLALDDGKVKEDRDSWTKSERALRKRRKQYNEKKDNSITAIEKQENRRAARRKMDEDRYDERKAYKEYLTQKYGEEKANKLDERNQIGRTSDAHKKWAEQYLTQTPTSNTFSNSTDKNSKQPKSKENENVK